MTTQSRSSQPPVAIIGMGALFANSKNLKSYWRILRNGIDCITDPPESHSQLQDIHDVDPKKPDHIYCNRGGFLPPLPFDPTEFGIPPTALEATDTSQLLGLVAAKMALSDAGYGDGREFDRDRTSVILGVTGTQELVISLGSRLGHPFWRKALDGKGLDDRQIKSIIDDISDSYVSWQENSFPGLLGNVVAGRICNRLNLGGTNCVVDAACASSLSAIHLAILELTSGKSNMVVTGGVDTINDPFMHMCFAKTGVLSHTGNARPFSADADGTVLGEGIGIVVLRRLEDAERDRDRIYAVIRGIGSSSDGKSQSIYAPRADGQARALREAYRNAGIPIETVNAIEAHGTGTRVGDEVEFSALKSVFGEVRPNGNRCALGSVKSMIGHTKAAAGAAGLIKSALSLYNKVLLPTLKATVPDPKLEIESSPFYLNNRSRPWFKPKDHPRRSGVSAFGFGGSNFHVVLEEYRQENHEIGWDGSVEILAFSAEDPQSIIDEIDRLRDALREDTRPFSLEHAASRLRGVFSTDHPFRLVLVVETDLFQRKIEDHLFTAREIVTNGKDTFSATQGIYFGSPDRSPGEIAFLFPGQGSQYIDMGRDLACCFPEAMAAIESFDSRFEHETALGELIFPRPALSDEQKQQYIAAIGKTNVAQPAIGAISLAMFSVLSYFGIRPHCTCGHSYGEIPALYAAGWIDKDTLVNLSAIRGRLMAAAGKDRDAGTMMAVMAPIQEIGSIAAEHKGLVLANINSPQQGVLSGTTQSIEAARDACAEKGYSAVMLPVAAAFHSPLVQEAQIPFSEALAKVRITPSAVPVYANVTASCYPEDAEAAVDLLGRQLTAPVRFMEMVENLYKHGVRTFVEVGPKRVLSGLVRSTLHRDDVTAIAVDRSAGKNAGILDLAHVIGHLAALGVPVELNRWEEQPTKGRLPKMVVPLSGANYRVPRKKRANPPPQKAADVHQPHPQRTGVVITTGENAPKPKLQHNDEMKPNESKHQSPNGMTRQNSDEKPSRTEMNQALALIQKGLESIQAIQQQTAKAHQLFLESQSQASRTLQAMMASSRALMGNALDIAQPEVFNSQLSHVSNPSLAPSQAAAFSDERPSSPQKTPAGHLATVAVAKPSIPINTNRVSLPLQPPTDQPPSAVSRPTDDEDVRAALLSVVSELTGYPEEMLGMEMDIEADLGIDSIKRVEILSAVEAQMPHLPQVTPEMVGTLKTLGQICAFLSSENFGTKSDGAVSSGEPSVTTQGQDVQSTLLSVVSELTGYPEEMLGMEMDIEADLGIDSIKRVEILSAVEAQMPHLPQVTPEMVGTLKTLGQICAFLSSENFGTKSDGAVSSGEPSVTTQGQDVQSTLLSVVSELTGYPEEMLGMEMDIEADLGIDSIKRVEILSAVEAQMPHLPQVTPEMVGTLKTLGQICAFLSSGNAPDSVNPKTDIEEADKELVSRRIVNMIESVKPSGRPFAMNSGRWLGVMGEAEPFARSLVVELQKRGLETRLIPLDRVENPDSFIGAAGLVIPGTVSPETAFLAAKHCGPELIVATQKGDALFATLTMMDGAFGFAGNRFDNPEQGALAGLAKTASLEWESVTCRAVDLSPEISDPETMAKQVADELLAVTDQGPIEVGLFPDRRVTLTSVPAQTVEGRLGLGPDDVVVITGGARGVTAHCALALARATGSQIALIGRSPAPFDTPGWLVGMETEAAMKKAILANHFTGTAPSPKQLEFEFHKQMSNIAICRTIDRIRETGVNARYFSADVTKKDELDKVIHCIREEMGVITTLIHGAGILRDKRIMDKTLDQFRLVYRTKVQGFANLMSATQADPLRYLVLFSSVSARTGNTGQCDYAMANEALNKLARMESFTRKGCQVSAINWGPWDGGMVSPALKKVFVDNHVALIPLEAGARMMVAEMQNADTNPVEVIIGSMLDTEDQENAQLAEQMKILERRELDLERYPVLRSHVIGGKPVVPFALMGEWMGHGALKGNPGFSLHGIDDFRLLSGIRIGKEGKLVRLMAGQPRKNGDDWHVNVELRNGVKNGKDVIHSRARALLVNRFPAAPPYTGNGKNGGRAFPWGLDDVYGEILFHGQQLRAIQSIEEYSDHGMTAKLTAAPKPELWMDDPIRERWTADPMVLDGAFQMATVWCFEAKKAVCLPSYTRSYRQYRRNFPEIGVTAVMSVVDANHRKMVADFVFLDDEKQVVATLHGYEAIVDESLIHHFKNNRLQSAIIENIQ